MNFETRSRSKVSILDTLVCIERQQTVANTPEAWPVRKLELAGTWVVWLRLLSLPRGCFLKSEPSLSLSLQLFFAPEPVT